ncbi:hypothetical protein B0H16DRAFT_1704438 [Mycena metata]|uniref:Uncharacterized protein n=1 Tax=Mycena metata TaxID=1033252 RepID=A0AAD7M9F1_9AGAR|nr:hypothetical protein B0H16DRAFT_1704438 [Mycena metata]
MNNHGMPRPSVVHPGHIFYFPREPKQRFEDSPSRANPFDLRQAVGQHGIQIHDRIQTIIGKVQREISVSRPSYAGDAQRGVFLELEEEGRWMGSNSGSMCVQVEAEDVGRGSRGREGFSLPNPRRFLYRGYQWDLRWRWLPQPAHTWQPQLQRTWQPEQGLEEGCRGAREGKGWILGRERACTKPKSLRWYGQIVSGSRQSRVGMPTAPVFTGGTGPANGTPSRAVSTSASTNKRAGTGGSTAVNTRPLTAVDGRRRVGEFYQAFQAV